MINATKDDNASNNDADRIADLAEQSADLTRNQQVLFGMEQQKSLPLVVDDESAENNATAKKGFFKKILGKKINRHNFAPI